MKADFSKIIKDSIRITKTNKRLWVFGLVLASLGAGGGGFGSGGNFGDIGKEIQKQQQENNVDYKTQDEQTDSTLLNSNLVALGLPQVLGAAESRIDSTANSLTELLKTIPVTFYVALVLLLVVCIAVSTAVALYARSWAQAGLIHGIDRENVGESLSLSQMSDNGKLNTLEVIKISIFPGLMLTLVVLLSIAILAIPAVLLGEGGAVISAILGIFIALAIVIAAIIVSASVNLGVLAINLEGLKWKEAFNRGFRVFKKFFMDIFILGIINCFAGCVFGAASLAGVVILGAIGALAVAGVAAFPPFLVAAGPIIFLAILALIVLMGLIGAISAVFNQSTWVLLYRQLTEENNGQQ